MIQTHAYFFERCIGGVVNVQYEPKSQKYAEDVIADVGENRNRVVGQSSGQGIYQAWTTRGVWLASISEGLEDLTPWISRTPAMRQVWNDVAYTMRIKASAGAEKKWRRRPECW